MPAPPGENRCQACGAPRTSSSEPCAECGHAAPSVLGYDLACRRCGYSLRGLGVESLCPECGAPVQLSLMGDFLAASDPAHVARLLRGAILVEITLYVGVLLTCIGSPLTLAIASPRGSGMVATLLGLIHLLLGLASALGWWLVSTRDPAGRSEGRGEASRRTLRVCAAISAGSTLLGAGSAASSMLIPDPVVLSMLVRSGVAIGAIAWVVQYFVSVGYVRVLAARVPSVQLGATAKTAQLMPLWIFGLGLPLLVVAGLSSAWMAPFAIVAILILAGMSIASLVWFVWYCSMVSGLRDRLETVRATMPQVLPD